jgi:hypothetical protein
MSVSGQHEIYSGVALEGGFPFNSYKSDKNILSSRFPSFHMGGSISAEYRLYRYVGIEAGLAQNVHLWKFKDKDFAARNDGYNVKLNSTSYYWSAYAAINLYVPVSSGFCIYGQGGLKQNMIGGGAVTESKEFIITGETAKLTNEFASENKSWFAEAGIQSMLSDNALFFIGLRFNNGLTSFSKSYYVRSKDGVNLAEDEVSSAGTYLGLNLGLKFRLYHKEKRSRPVRQVQPQVPPKTPPQPQQPSQQGKVLDKSVNGRPLVVNQTINVSKTSVKVLIWDDQKEDGDKVSLNLNGNWILQDYTLQKKKIVLNVNLNTGENHLVLHALNLGKIPPNTAMLIVDDGVSQQQINLASDLNTSGTLIINVK